jgi:hypothetical protein
MAKEPLSVLIQQRHCSPQVAHARTRFAGLVPWLSYAVIASFG